MSDWYQQLTNTPIGRRVTSQLGLPAPEVLRRHSPGAPLLDGPALLGGAPGGRLDKPIREVLDAAKVEVHDRLAGGDVRYGALIFDATGITEAATLRELYLFGHEAVRRMGPSSRLLVLSGDPARIEDPAGAAAQQALEGFVRSAGKEMRRGATANLVRVGEGAEDGIASTLRFFLSGRSAYVSGQVVTLARGAEAPVAPDDPDRPLDGKVAIVTGAARGIGASIADVLARDGSRVVCIDVPGQGQQLTNVANRVGGEALQLDVTADDAAGRLIDHLQERHGGVDIVVHNAGVTRDKTLAGMDEDRWDAVLTVNLIAPQRLTNALHDAGTINDGGRLIAVSSVTGIAGNRGQTNYTTSKAGLIGFVRALGDRPGTANAVAPGFIETEMTGAMPLGPREIGRRMNSLNQGGVPEDVAETIAWLAQPGSSYVDGQVVRVCGQSMIGA